MYSMIFNMIMFQSKQKSGWSILHNDHHTVYETIRSGQFKVVTVQGNLEP